MDFRAPTLSTRFPVEEKTFAACRQRPSMAPAPLRSTPPKPAIGQKDVLELAFTRSRTHPRKLSRLSAAPGDDFYLASANTTEASCQSKNSPRVAKLTAPQAHTRLLKLCHLRRRPGRPSPRSGQNLRSRPTARSDPRTAWRLLQGVSKKLSRLSAAMEVPFSSLRPKPPKPAAGRKAAPESPN